MPSDRFVGDYRLAQRGIRCRQHGRQDRGLQQGQPAKQSYTHREPEQDGQRQTNHQQTLRDMEALFEKTEIRIGGVGEQDQREGQLGEGAHLFPVHAQVKEPQPNGA
jgi:hypothetical protein